MGFTRDQHYFTHQNAGVGNQRAAWLEDDLGQLVAKVFLQEAGNFFRVGLQGVGLGQVVGREAPAHVDHLQGDVVFFLQTLEDHLDLGNGGIPGADVALLRAHVEGDAVGLQAQFLGQHQQVHGHVGLAAELA